MNQANMQLKVYRKPDCVDKYGEKLKTCLYEEIGILYCVKRYYTNNQFVQAQEIAQEMEMANFIWHNCDQPEFFNIEKGDYFAFTANGEKYFYLVKMIRSRGAFRFGKGKNIVSFKTIGERKIPRECPKEIINQYGSDELENITPSA